MAEVKDYAQRLKSSGVEYSEIAEMLNKDFPNSFYQWDPDKAKKPRWDPEANEFSLRDSNKWELDRVANFLRRTKNIEELKAEFIELLKSNKAGGVLIYDEERFKQRIVSGCLVFIKDRGVLKVSEVIDDGFDGFVWAEELFSEFAKYTEKDFFIATYGNYKGMGDYILYASYLADKDKLDIEIMDRMDWADTEVFNSYLRAEGITPEQLEKAWKEDEEIEGETYDDIEYRICDEIESDFTSDPMIMAPAWFRKRLEENLK